MIHTLIENSAPRPQLYQQVRTRQILAEVRVQTLGHLDLNSVSSVAPDHYLSIILMRPSDREGLTSSSENTVVGSQHNLDKLDQTEARSLH